MEWREDKSNQDAAYGKRNAVRLKLMPLLAELAGGRESLSNRLFALSDQSLQVRNLLEDEVIAGANSSM